MIICFYPGGCGNRFYHWLKNDSTFEPNLTYDRVTPYQVQSNRYPGYNGTVENTPVVFTHNMNYYEVCSIFPGHDRVFMIVTDLFDSLKRQWSLEQQVVSENCHPAGGPFSTIKWHVDYYNNHPYDAGLSTLVNKDSYPDFYNSVVEEINSIDCPNFDFAVNMFNTYGSGAPILDLYQKHIDEQR